MTLARTLPTPGASSADGVIEGRSGTSFSICDMVVPEWIFMFGEPLYSSTTADSIRYQWPYSIAGAFARLQTTNRMAPLESAMIPLCAIEGDIDGVRETIFPSIVTHSPGAISFIGRRSEDELTRFGRLCSRARSPVTVRSASATLTPNSSTRRRRRDSIFWRSGCAPLDSSFLEILSVTSDRFITYISSL